MSYNKQYINRILFNNSNFLNKKSSIPQKIDIELTERCNNNCIHCYINQPENDEELKKKELSTQRLKEIIKEIADLGCLSIRFTGGEPLLRKDFKELYLFTRRQGLKVVLFTNATLIDEELVSLFVKYPPGDKIEITLYGTDEKSYQKAAGVKGNFKKAINGINLLEKNNISFIVKGIYFSGREKQAQSLINYSRHIPYMDDMPSFSMNFDLRARRDSKEKNEIIKSLRVSPEETIKFISMGKEEYIKGTKEFAKKFMRPAGDSIFNCGCGKGGAVDAYGKFQPCLLLRHPDALYDLENGSIKDALNVFFVELRKQKSKNLDYLNKCAKCFLSGFCENCPAKSWMEHGVLDSPVDYYCEIAHAKARFLGLLNENEFGWEVKDFEKRIAKFCE
ncbi:MAG: radical SAM protein [Desulforegulaceae bacterium]|nr:radical SAM protein [Desulforegulaceae bacterium]